MNQEEYIKLLIERNKTLGITLEAIGYALCEEDLAEMTKAELRFELSSIQGMAKRALRKGQQNEVTP